MPEKIYEHLSKKKIKITKYNYSFDEQVQNFNCQEAYMEISGNGD